jgi:hypothetical protein
MFGKKKVKPLKNQSKTFVDGKEVSEKIPELEVPKPDNSQTVVQEPETLKMSAEEVFEEGRSVGFQEGMIHSLNHLNAEIVRIQKEMTSSNALKMRSFRLRDDD